MLPCRARPGVPIVAAPLKSQARARRIVHNVVLLALGALAAFCGQLSSFACSDAFAAAVGTRWPSPHFGAATRTTSDIRCHPCARQAAAGSPAGGDNLRLWLPSTQLVDAVQQLGGRVTKADLLAQGLPAAGLERDLLQLARASGAALQVNKEGELLYEFPEDWPRALRRHSAAMRLQRAWRVTKPWLGWGGRVLFGVSLLATVAIVYCASMVVIATTTSSKEDSDGNHIITVAQNNFVLWFGSDLLFWLTPSPYSYYTYYGGDVIYSEFYEPPPKMSFLESVFSFVFGDGDPNEKLLSETRWQLIGECIAQNGGSVIAEQIAPYLDPPSGPMGDEAARQRALNNAMLPVLVRFKGMAEVGTEGDIIYVFPELQESRVAGEAILGSLSTDELKRRLEAVGAPSRAFDRERVIEDYRRVTGEMRLQSSVPANYLPEQELKLSEADDGQVATCVGLGAFALLATLFLGSRIYSGHLAILARFYPIIAFVVKAYPFLLGYTVAFLGIPALRWFRLRRLNRAIQERNEWRSLQAAKLEQADTGLRSRIMNAAKRAFRKQAFGDALYDSSQSASQNQTQKDVDDLKSFDALLQGKG